MTTTLDYRNPFPADSDDARELLARARRLEAAADRAFARFMRGEVRSSSGAASLQAKANEAWADVRLGIVGGDLIEARECGLSS